MSQKPIVLTFVRHYLPGFKSGGPLRTIANVVERLGGEFAFRIVTSDRDATDSRPYPNLRGGGWCAVGAAEVLYLPPERQGFRAIGRLLAETRHDLLYLNSFFDPRFSILPLLARRLARAPNVAAILAPRGEFAPAALAMKRAKKRTFLALARLGRLHPGLVWQVSSEPEGEDLRRAMGRLADRVIVAPDLACHPAPIEREKRGDGPLRLLFLSRISPMKNLDVALRALALVKSPVRFEIRGPIRDPGHWRACRALIDRLPPHVAASYGGSVEPADVPAVMAGADLFFLPTRGESYGHAILEALGAGAPVLISDRTPWRGLAEKGIGWDLPLGSERRFAGAIDAVAAMPPAERFLMRRKARAFAESVASDETAAAASRALFHAALSGSRAAA